ncbi:MAG: hypothetical protein GY940_24720, partial [bacterium]|nr:hypothetical protein [bacterium]
RFLNIKIENWGYGSGMFVTMFLGGLWHGAGWNFVLWGSLHGLYLVVYRAFTTGSKHKRKRNRSLKITHPLSALKMIPMYLLVTLTWLPFRAPDIHATGIYLRRLFDWTGALDFSQLPLILFLLLVMVIMDLPAYTRDDHLYLLALPSWLQNAILFSGFLAVAITMLLHLNAVRPFIYFQF